MASPGGSPPPLAPFSDFPEDVQLSILSFLHPPDVAAFARTSRRSAALCAESRLWSALCHRRWGPKILIRSGGGPFDLLYRALDRWDALVGFWRRTQWVATCAGAPPLVSFEWDPSAAAGNGTAERSSAASEEPLGLEWPAEARRATKPLDGLAGPFFILVVLEVLTCDVLIPFEVARGRLGDLTHCYFLLGYPEDPWMPFVRRVWGFLVRRRGLVALRVWEMANLEAASDVVDRAVNWMEGYARGLETAARILDLEARLVALRAELVEAQGRYDAACTQIAERKRRREEESVPRASRARANIARLRQEQQEDSAGSLPAVGEVMTLNPFYQAPPPPPPPPLPPQD